MNEFFDDIWRGLNASQKYLPSKYFYDEAGDAIFREIMECPEYYLTRCELDIFSTQSNDLVDSIIHYLQFFDVIELGPGDGSKSVYLLDALVKQNADFTYYPLDISKNIITNLHKELPVAIPGLRIHGLNGDYFNMLGQLKEVSGRNKIVLFLGSNIGNIPFDETVDFFKALRNQLTPGDLILTGFDLKKDPAVILAAYNDKAGITRRFNLNLLQRINNTLDADFDLSQFEHVPAYNEETGSCRSYLKSRKDQHVRISEAGRVHFKEGEQIFMEISQKYTVEQTNEMARASGFTVVQHFYDSRKWFLDALWQYR